MKCFWIFWHDWSKWSDVVKDYSADRNQYRYCKKCNRQQKRKAFLVDYTTDEQIINGMKGENK